MANTDYNTTTYILAAKLLPVISTGESKYIAYRLMNGIKAGNCSLSDIAGQQPDFLSETPEGLAEAILKANPPPKEHVASAWVRFLGLPQGEVVSDSHGFVDVFSKRPLDSKEFEQFTSIWQSMLEHYSRLGVLPPK